MNSDGPRDSAAQPPAFSAAPRPVRWWPAVVILVGAVLAAGWFHFFAEESHQHRNIHTTEVFLIVLLLLLLWCALFSRLRWRIRLLTLGAVAGVVLALAASVRIRGVTGDLLPIFEWRWQRDQSAELPVALAQGALAPRGTNAAPAERLTGSWPQFLGPNRDATLAGPRLARDWVAHPPQELWRRPVGAGWSGFAVAGSVAVTQEQRGPDETVVAYDALSGRPLWAHADAARYFTTIAGEGPRATPAIDGDRVFTAGATGILNCLDLQTGRLIWSKEILRENGGSLPGWGWSVSPLVRGDLVVVSAGGANERSLVAYHKQSGQFAWGAGHDRVGYSSPVVFALGGAPQILMFNASSIAGHDAGSGRWLWEYPWRSSNPNVAVPVQLPGDRVLVSSGYGVGSEALQVAKTPGGGWQAKRVWKSTRLKAKFTNVVFHDGFIYGLDDGILVCLDAATGEQKWKDGRYGHGQVILVDKLLLLTAENGEVALLEPGPRERRELGRFTAFRTKTWNPPALAGEWLFLRTDLEAACFRLPVEK